MGQVASPYVSQVSLPLSEPVDFAVIKLQRTFWEACELVMRVAGLNAKQVYMTLKIDKGHWSRIESGEAHFPHLKLEAFLDLLGNDIPLQWLAWRRGKGLHTLESEQQRIIRAKDEEIAELRKHVEWTKQLVRGQA